MLTPYLKKLVKRENLKPKECESAFNLILSMENPIQIAAFLMLMRAKGETAEELTAFVKAGQAHQITVNAGMPVLDIVGTGGDHANTVNISTGASILIAACSVPVLKHGNRAASSSSGSADALEALGLKLVQTADEVARSVQTQGIGFCFSPAFLPALVGLKELRSQLKMPTFFNFLGPLLNPGQAAYRVVGVFDGAYSQLFADILVQLGVTRALVVHGNGLDELSCIGPCDVIEINRGEQKKYQLDPAALGFPRCELNDLVGGNALHNAAIIRKVLDNEPGHVANTMILNAAAAVYIYGKAATLDVAVALVRANIANGKAKLVLEGFIRSSHE